MSFVPSFSSAWDHLQNKLKVQSSRWVAAPALAFGAMGSALAEVPADVTTAVGSLKADASAIAVAVLLAVVAIFAIKFIRKGL